MVQRVEVCRPIVVVPVGLSRDTRQRRVELLWVQACGGEVFIDPAGRRLAVFGEYAQPPDSLLRRPDTCLVEEIPVDWKRLA